MPDRTYEDDVVRDRQKGRMSMDVKDTTYTGTLQISVVSALGMSPISGATVTISYTGVSYRITCNNGNQRTLINP